MRLIFGGLCILPRSKCREQNWRNFLVPWKVDPGTLGALDGLELGFYQNLWQVHLKKDLVGMKWLFGIFESVCSATKNSQVAFGFTDWNIILGPLRGSTPLPMRDLIVPTTTILVLCMLAHWHGSLEQLKENLADFQPALYCVSFGGHLPLTEWGDSGCRQTVREIIIMEEIPDQFRCENVSLELQLSE